MPTTEYPTPSYPPVRLRQAAVSLNPATSTWTFTGVGTEPGDLGLSVIVTGFTFFGPPNYWAYPEGAYAADSARPPVGGFPQTTRYDPSAVFSGGWGGAPALVCPDQIDFSVVLALVPRGSVPAADGSFRGAIRPARGAHFGPQMIPHYAADVYAIFNDQLGQYGNNSGSFTLYLNVGGDPSEV
jgi:hypothetical protein